MLFKQFVMLTGTGSKCNLLEFSNYSHNIRMENVVLTRELLRIKCVFYYKIFNWTLNIDFVIFIHVGYIIDLTKRLLFNDPQCEWIHFKQLGSLSTCIWTPHTAIINWLKLLNSNQTSGSNWNQTKVSVSKTKEFHKWSFVKSEIWRWIGICHSQPWASELKMLHNHMIHV